VDGSECLMMHESMPLTVSFAAGWLFILLRRPYDIGDRIHISNPESDTSPNGSAGWIVKDGTCIYTTVSEMAVE